MDKFSTRYLDSGLATDAEIAQKQSISAKNQPLGYAGLDAQGKIFPAQLPPLSDTVEVIEGGSPTSIYLTENIDGGNP